MSASQDDSLLTDQELQAYDCDYDDDCPDGEQCTCAHTCDAASSQLYVHPLDAHDEDSSGASSPFFAVTSGTVLMLLTLLFVICTMCYALFVLPWMKKKKKLTAKVSTESTYGAADGSDCPSLIQTTV